MRYLKYLLLIPVVIYCCGCEILLISILVGAGVTAGSLIVTHEANKHSLMMKATPTPTPIRLSEVPYDPSWGDAISPNSQMSDLTPH